MCSSDLANTWLRIATAHGAEIRSGCMVIDLLRDSVGQISDVVYLRDGVRYRQRCRHVFLCGGAIETPRLLLRAGLANSSGQVGRNYMAHVATQVWGLFDDEMRMNKGYPSSLITEDFLRAEDADFAAQIHYWTTPISQCRDGRTDVTCTDYGDWTTAWTEIKG